MTRSTLEFAKSMQCVPQTEEKRKQCQRCPQKRLVLGIACVLTVVVTLRPDAPRHAAAVGRRVDEATASADEDAERQVVLMQRISEEVQEAHIWLLQRL